MRSSWAIEGTLCCLFLYHTHSLSYISRLSSSCIASPHVLLLQKGALRLLPSSFVLFHAYTYTHAPFLPLFCSSLLIPPPLFSPLLYPPAGRVRPRVASSLPFLGVVHRQLCMLIHVALLTDLSRANGCQERKRETSFRKHRGRKQSHTGRRSKRVE